MQSWTAATRQRLKPQKLQKRKPQVINYNNYKNFHNDKFQFSISMLRLKRNTFEQRKHLLWQKTCIKKLWNGQG